MSVSEPGKIITPWAESGLKNPIPPAANQATGRAGFDQGFSAINMTAKEAGGIPPFGQDFNGIFYEVTNILRYMQAGGQPTFDAALATAIGGYPKGAMVLGSDGVSVYTNRINSNSANPDLGGGGWANSDLMLREALRRSYAEAGYTLVDGSFEVGGTLVNANDVLLHESSGKAFSGPAGPVAAGTSPTSGGFVDVSNKLGVEGLQKKLDDLAAGMSVVKGRVSVLEQRKSTCLVNAAGTGAPHETVATQLPAKVAINSRYVLPNPFGNNTPVICWAEIFAGGVWAQTGFVYSAPAGGYGVAATYVQGSGVVVQTGAERVATTSSYAGGGHGASLDLTSAPCRVFVRKLEA